MSFAEVAVDAPVAQRCFSYSVPKGLAVLPGQLVWVPFGARVLQGIVVELAEVPRFEPTKDIAGTLSAWPLLTPVQLRLATWMSEYYLCSVFTAASLMLPPDYRQRVITYFSISSNPASPVGHLTKPQDLILRYVQRRGTVRLQQLGKAFPKMKARTVAGQLVRKGLLIKTDELERPKVGPKTVKFVRLIVAQADLEASLSQLRLGKTPKEADLLEHLASFGFAAVAELKAQPFGSASVTKGLVEKQLIRRNKEEKKIELVVTPAEALEWASKLRRTERADRLASVVEVLRDLGARVASSQISELTGASGSDLAALAKAGLIAVEEEDVFRDPLARRVFPQSAAPELTPAQERIWREVEAGMVATTAAFGSTGSPSVFLLHGVTGSGKTEIYLRALSVAVGMGRRAIVTVPEIALTPQTVGRFLGRFPGRVAVLHSRLSVGEQYDEWRRIKAGEFDVVIGSRSAIFAPVPDLGLIVLDEEHEWTYKQWDAEPRYHSRDVAIKLSELTGALVILGSATPDVVSYYRAQTSEHRLVELRERIASSGWLSTPRSGRPGRLSSVDIVDLRQELRAGNRSIFSRSLVNATNVALAAHEQVIFFLNRRGTSTFVICRDCGFVLKCKRCDATLTYHSAEDDMICHLCNYRTLAPDACPNCLSPRIRYLGVGTQKVEEEARKAFPGARLLRWDRDSARRKGAHEEILDRFTAHEADILVGTQMIAKGLDLPTVTLVGVICADIGLHLPDYRAGEHTFQLLTQVAGRAGRGVLGGRTIIQTYSPEHYAVVAASQQDYEAFYRREIAFRGEHENPPFSQLARLMYVGSNNEKCQKEAQRVGELVKHTIASLGITDASLIGPAPAYISRLRGRYRWQIVVRGHHVSQLIASIQVPSGWLVDVDPVSLL